jgi:lipopolysaccharide export LptBFGC system permease protein LptF
MRILDRYILAELIRSVVLTTAVLVTVIAFGAAIKPLARDDLLTAGQTARYVILAIVPMLQFALPFAAGFASTVTLHRMTTDNEIIAAAVGGISYRRLLVPIVALGLVLTVVMALLTHSIIPRFWALLEAAIAQDVTRIFQAQIESGEPFTVGDRQIYADDIWVIDRPEGTDADTRLILLRVAAVDLSETGHVTRDMTAAQAVIDVYREPEATYLALTMSDAVAYQPDGGVLAWAERFEPAPIAIPTGQRRDARHMTRGQLLALRRDPDQYGDVIAARRELARRLREHDAWRALDERMRETGALLLEARTPERPLYEVVADGLEGDRFTVASGAITVRQLQDGRVRRLLVAREARIVRHEVAAEGPIAFDLVLTGCEVVDTDFPGPPNQRESLTLKDLVALGFAPEAIADRPSAELLDRASSLGAAAPAVIGPADVLRDHIRSLQLNITSRLHLRSAMSVTALLLLVIGATLAMWRRESAPLSIYLWAFVPSILDVILISSGGQMMRDGSTTTGLAVMWSGNAALAAIFVFAFRRLSRH